MELPVWWPCRCMSEIPSTAQPEVWDSAGDIGPEQRYHYIWCRYSWSPENNESQRFCWLPLLIYRAHACSLGDESFPFEHRRQNILRLAVEAFYHPLLLPTDWFGTALNPSNHKLFLLVCVIRFDWVMTLRGGGASFDINSINWVQRINIMNSLCQHPNKMDMARGIVRGIIVCLCLSLTGVDGDDGCSPFG